MDCNFESLSRTTCRRAATLPRSLVILGLVLAIFVFMQVNVSVVNSVGTGAIECKSVLDKDTLGGINIGDIYWSADGESLVFNDVDERTLFVQSITSNQPFEQVEAWETPLAWHPQISEMAWQADGTKLALSKSETIEILDTEGSLLHSLAIISTGVSWSNDGNFLAISGIRGIRNPTPFVQFYDTSTYALYAELESRFIESFVWHPASNLIAFPQTFAGEDAELYGIEVYDLDTQATQEKLYLKKGALQDYQINLLHDLMWLNQGDFLVAEFDMVALDPVLWDVNSAMLADTDLPSAQVWDSSGKFLTLIKAEDNITVEIWDANSMNLVDSFTFDESIYEIKINPNMENLVVSNSHAIQLCSFKES